MKKTILIPTDFTVQSLNVLKTVLANNTTNLQFDIVLLHGVSLSDSIRDLLFYSKAKQIVGLSNIEFEEAFEVIKNKFDSQINSMRIDLFTGYNQAAFNNYLEGNKVEQIVMTNQKLQLTNSKSFNLETFIHKSNVDVFVIDAVEVATLPEKGKIAEVFFNHAQVG